MTVMATALVVGMGLIGPGAASAAPPPLLTQFPEDGGSGSGANQMTIPLGIAANPDTGDVYVSEGLSDRISEFTATGGFIRSFGWDVAPDGSPGDTADDELEVCSEVCQGGANGSGAGQFNTPSGLAVDASGAVYVLDFENRRVQKFSASGEFLLMFGGEVNKTSGENVCTKADLEGGEICGVGVVGVDPGQFSGWNGGDFIDIGPDGTIFIGDQSRVQKFDSDGTYKAQIPLPDERAARALAVDPVSGDAYVALALFPDMPFETLEVFYRLDPDTGAVLDEIEVGDPNGTDAVPFALRGFTQALAVDSAGNVYAIADQQQTTKQPWLEVVGFDPSGVCLAGLCPGDEFGKGVGGTSLSRIATSAACEVPSDNLFAGYNGSGKSYVRSYGPAPDCGGTSASPPQIRDQYAISVGSNESTVRAEINPRSQPDTTYYVEYGIGECALGGCQAQPTSPGSLLTNEVTGLPVISSGVFLSGLEPGTTYHYRFVARSSLGGQVKGVGGKVNLDGEEGTFTTFPLPHLPNLSCSNQAFRTGPSAFLPDCRAYEMVSPVDKENGDIIATESPASGPASFAQSSPNGAKLSYSAYRAFGDAESAPWTSQYIAERGAGGWSSEAISPPREGKSIPDQTRGLDIQYTLFSPDLCSGWLLQDTSPILASGAPQGFPNIYRRENCGDTTFAPLIRTTPQLTQPRQFWLELQGVSADGECAVFRANAKLTPEASDETVGIEGVYQTYETCGSQTRLISLLPDNSASDLHSSVGTASGERLVPRGNSVSHALSADGSRVYWTESDHSIKAAGKIYVRENSDQEQSALVGTTCTEPDKACTYPVSGLVSAGDDGRFLGANPQGSAALFTIGGALYRFDFAAGASSVSLIAGSVKGLLGASEDLSRIYFASEEDRAPGASAGKPNLYFYDEGSFAFLGTLANADVQIGNQRRAINIEPWKHPARVSPDGRTAAFMASAALTGYDNADATTGGPAAEVYLYDADAEGGAGALSCVSCNPTGARPSGRDMEGYSVPAIPLRVAAQLPTWETQLYARRALADDGSHLFFESFEGLVLRDTNGREDVYEWQPAGSAKECEEIGAELFVANARGCISLISSGEGSGDSSFVDATPNGSDVFFKTESSLLAQDPGLVDIYDARVNGGFPPPPPPVAPCEGEACQSSPGPPNDATPASSAFRGPGNFRVGPKSRPRCPKGKSRAVRRGKTRCVKKQTKTQTKRTKRQHRKAAAR